MMSFNQIMRWSWAFLVAVTLSLGLAGCEGDDGAPGADGMDGDDGLAGAAGLACWDLNGNGEDDPDEDTNGDGAFTAADCQPAVAKVTPLESCDVCHGDGSFAAATDFHALDPIESVSNVAFAVNGLDLDVTFDLAVDGAPGMGYDTITRGYRTDGAVRTNICNAPSRSDPCDLASLELFDNTGGNYTLRVYGGAAEALNDNRYLFRVGIGDDSETRVYFYGDTGTTRVVEDLAFSAQACNACHGPEGIGVHGGYFAAEDGGEPCLACHGSLEPDEDNPGEFVLIPSLAVVAHGYHSGIATWEDPQEEIEVTYPTYMNNCSVCHSEDAQLAAANAAEVSGAFCFTCHGSMEGLGFAATDPIHGGLDETSDCSVCHGNPAVPSAPATVAAMHNRGALAGRLLDNDGVLWNGEDTSVTEGAKFDWKIDNVAEVTNDDDTVDLNITWSASYDGAPVDVCNADVAAGPVFHDGGLDEDGEEVCRLRIYRSYAQGEDFIMGTSTSGAGQPGRADVCASNTDCVDGVATTTIPADAMDADVGRVALNGKPLVVSPVPDVLPDMVARAPTPTFDWLVGLGGPAPERRGGLIVDTGKCVGCHVGSLYQHGGDRVDNVNTCLVCHNAASNEQYVRSGMGVDASEAYDGKVGETFELKTMIHRLHSVNFDWNPLPDDRNTPDVVENVEYNPPYLVYRGRGIYAFANDVSQVPNWAVGDACTDRFGRPGNIVFGADPALDTNVTCQVHNFHSATYPRSLNECTACHTADPVIPDQTKAMASTTEAGSTKWENQLDDVLQGAATTSCVTCHAGGAARGHAYQNSWTPQVFPEGRQTIIDAVN